MNERRPGALGEQPQKLDAPIAADESERIAGLLVEVDPDHVETSARVSDRAAALLAEQIDDERLHGR